MGDHQEQRLLRRLLDDFQQAVGRFLVHLLRQVHHHAPPAALHARQGQLVEDEPGLADGDQTGLALDAKGLVELVFRKAGPLERQLPEPLHVTVGGGLLGGGDLAAAGHREDEMDVRVDHLRHLAGPAVQRLEEGQAQGERPAAVVLIEKDGVRHAARRDHVFHGGDRPVVSCEGVEEHPNRC